MKLTGNIKVKENLFNYSEKNEKYLIWKKNCLKNEKKFICF